MRNTRSLRKALRNESVHKGQVKLSFHDYHVEMDAQTIFAEDDSLSISSVMWLCWFSLRKNSLCFYIRQRLRLSLYELHQKTPLR